MWMALWWVARVCRRANSSTLPARPCNIFCGPSRETTQGLSNMKALIGASAAILSLGILIASGTQAQQPIVAGGFTVLAKPPGKVQSQDMGAFPKGSWQDGDQLWWTGAKPGDKLTLVIPIKEEGTYQVSIILTKARDYGIVQLSLDG